MRLFSTGDSLLCVCFSPCLWLTRCWFFAGNETCLDLCKSPKAMASPTIRFDVGGKIYRTSKSLLESYPDSMLARLVSDTWNAPDTNEIFFIASGKDLGSRSLAIVATPKCELA